MSASRVRRCCFARTSTKIRKPCAQATTAAHPLQDVLEARGLAEGHEPLTNREQEILRQLQSALDFIQPDVEGLSGERQRTLRIIGVMRQNAPMVSELMRGRRLMDIAEHESIVRDFEARRSHLIYHYSGILLGVLSAPTMLLLFNGFRRTRLIE